MTKPLGKQWQNYAHAQFKCEDHVLLHILMENNEFYQKCVQLKFTGVEFKFTGVEFMDAGTLVFII